MLLIVESRNVNYTTSSFLHNVLSIKTYSYSILLQWGFTVVTLTKLQKVIVPPNKKNTISVSIL